jgi:dolichol-phosphate mannosyltransferase
MDGDQTHNPDFIPNICKLLGPGNADLVLTSRFMKEGGLINWDLSRIIITYLGHFLTTLFIGSRKDLTSGMRGYRCGKVPEEMLKILKKSNYEFFPLSFLFYKKSKMRIAQIPITLPNRFFGHSKITLKLLVRNIYCIVF